MTGPELHVTTATIRPESVAASGPINMSAQPARRGPAGLAWVLATGLLREAPGGDQMKAWPKTMRVFAAASGAPRPRSRRGRQHRQGHRTRAFPLARLQGQPGVARRVHDRLHPAGLAEAHRPWTAPSRRQSRRRCATASCTRRPPRPRRALQVPENRRDLALGRSDRHRLAAHLGHPAPHLTSATHPAAQERKPACPWNPGHPARQPGRRHTPGLKIHPQEPGSRPPAAAINSCERSGLGAPN